MGDLRLNKRRDKHAPLTWEEMDSNWDLIEEFVNRLQNGSGVEPPPPPPPPQIIVSPEEVTLSQTGMPIVEVVIESNVLWEVPGLDSGVMEWNDGSDDRLYISGATGETGMTFIQIGSAANNTGRDRNMFVNLHGLTDEVMGKVLVRQQR